MQRSCTDVNSPYKRKCWTNSGGPLVKWVICGRALSRTGYSVLPCLFWTVLLCPILFFIALQCCGSKFLNPISGSRLFGEFGSGVLWTKSLKLSTTWNFVILSHFRLAGSRFSIRVRNTASLCCNVCSKYSLEGHCTTHASTPTFQTTWQFFAGDKTFFME